MCLPAGTFERARGWVTSTAGYLGNHRARGGDIPEISMEPVRVAGSREASDGGARS